MPQINESEQWKHGGDCEQCRRRNYCSKTCKAAEGLLNARFMGHFFNAMLNTAIKQRKSDIAQEETT